MVRGMFTLLAAAVVAQQIAGGRGMQHAFEVRTAGEAVATVAAGCANCDWGVEGREAVLLTVDVDGRYSQHLALTRGAVADYRIVLGSLTAGRHAVTIARD